jgi:hypothetical protein
MFPLPPTGFLSILCAVTKNGDVRRFFSLISITWKTFFFFLTLREPSCGFANDDKLLVCIVSTIGMEGKPHLCLQLQLENHWKDFDLKWRARCIITSHCKLWKRGLFRFYSDTSHRVVLYYKQPQYTDQHNTFTSRNTVLHVSVSMNHHKALLVATIYSSVNWKN